MIWIQFLFIILITASSYSSEPDEVIIQYLYRPKNCKDIGEHGDTMHVQYLGRFYESKETFDSSYNRNNVPFNYQLGVGGVIEGYQMGTKNMCINERRRLIVPSKFAYGASGTGNIPGYSTLMFDVHLVQIGDNAPDYEVPIELKEVVNVIGDQTCEHPVTPGDVLTIVYTGWLPDGSVFDTSAEAGTSFVVGAGQILQGIDEGVVSYCKDSVIELEIPPTKAYGDKWDGPVPQWSFVYYNVTILDQIVYDQIIDDDNDLHCVQLKPCTSSYKVKSGDYITLNYAIMSNEEAPSSGEIRYPVGRQVFVPGWDEALLGSCSGQRKSCWIPGSKAHKMGTSLFLAPPQKGFWCELEVKNILLTYENDWDGIDLKDNADILADILVETAGKLQLTHEEL